MGLKNVFIRKLGEINDEIITKKQMILFYHLILETWESTRDYFCNDYARISKTQEKRDEAGKVTH